MIVKRALFGGWTTQRVGGKERVMGDEYYICLNMLQWNTLKLFFKKREGRQKTEYKTEI
jgi:hypothetical protein